METHLTTIGSTLEAIARLHANTPSSSRNIYRPFTCAVLNTYKLDILDYIRDADHVESNLFWYPPVPVAPSGSNAEAEAGQDTITSGVAARLPETRQIVPPTPLRKTAIEAEAKGLVQFEARTLLKAAQRLLDNYHHAPRARKHIKNQLKQLGDFEKQIKLHESTIKRNEALISKLSDPEGAKRMANSLFKEASKDEIRKLQDGIHKEEMEILAIDQLTQDLQEKREKLLSRKSQATSKPATKARSSTSTPFKAPPPRSGSVTPKASSPFKESFVTAVQSEKTSTSGRAESKLQLVSVILPGASEDNDVAIDDGEDTTLRHESGTREQNNTQEAEMMDTITLPESSDELERICESVWSLFGDNLRYVAVDREGADYQETLRVLQDLSAGKSSAGDASMGLSDSESQATAATSGSTGSASSNLDNAGPPSPTVAIAAHILSLLLTTSSPHVEEFDVLKTKAASWWTSAGREALRKSALNPEAVEFDESSSSLASRAVYSLIAKKLLRLQFRGAKRVVSFPAHIG